MRYQPPIYKIFQTLPIELKHGYLKAKGENPQRLDFIRLYEKLVNNLKLDTPENAIKVLLGALIYEMEIIEKEYKGSSPEIRKGWVYNTGSQLYTDIIQALGISKDNILNDDERLIHLFRFYHYIEKIAPENFADDLLCKTKAMLLNNIKVILKRVKQREFKKIDLLVHGAPNLTALKKNISQIYVNYQQAVSSRWFQNKKRNSALVFIDFIEHTCNDLYGKDIPEKNQTEESKDIAYLQAYNTRMGMIVFALTTINNEYTVLSAERSVLFQKCLKTINTKGLDKLEIDKKITWLRALSTHLSNIKSMKEYHQSLKSSWEAQGLGNLDHLQKHIDNELMILETEKSRPSRALEYLGGATSYAAQYGIGYAATKYLANVTLYTIPKLGLWAAAAATGPVGLVFYGAAGTIISTQLGRFVKDKIVPAAVAGLYAKLLEKIGEAVGNATAGVVVSAFSVSAKGISHLIGLYRQHAHDSFVQEWVDTLLGLPDDIMSRDEKDQIRQVLGIEQPVYQQSLAV